MKDSNSQTPFWRRESYQLNEPTELRIYLIPLASGDLRFIGACALLLRFQVDNKGVEPLLSLCKRDVLPLPLIAH